MKHSLFALSCWLLAPAAFAILDTNNNGLSDFWERDFNNGSLFDELFDPQGDADSDGWTNAQEAEAGTNPFDPNPPDGMIRPIAAHVPAIWSEPDEFNEIYLISPEAVTVTWPTLAGKQYTLYFSPDLTQGSWLPVGDPFIAYGGEATYGFEISQSDKCFWRVTATDVDSDYDGLSNYEEISAGTNPYGADSDGDTISDWQEFTSGTNPLNQDTDGDGIPDPIDSEPLVSSFGFADADGDGIPDADDAAPNDPRGPAPFIASENTSGNPLSNLTKDEAVKFVIAVSNPAGPAPTASNLALFLNGTEETATITVIGSPVGSSQRFLLTWVAKATANYPALTIQNLSLRFRDSAQATSWLNLARIDVAEWEGKIITLPFVSSEDSWGYDVMTHLNGMKVNQHFVARNSGANMLYRGPKTLKIINSTGGTSDLQLPDLAIPYLKISGAPGSPPTVVEQQDYANLATGMDVDFVFNNGSAKSLNFELGDAGINATLSPGQANFDSVSLVNAALPLGTSALISYLDGADWKPFYSSYWPVANIAGANSRILRSVNVLTTAAGQLKLHGVTNYMGRDAKITPHASGTLEYPGLPQESVTSEYDQKYMALGSEEWRKIVIKIYPPQQHFTYSKGYRLNLGTDTTGNAAPQTGWLAQTKSGDTFTPLTIPADGKIEILATDTNLYPQLTSPEGLVLFLKRDATVDQTHILSLEVLPIVETNNPDRIGSLNIFPVEVDFIGRDPDTGEFHNLGGVVDSSDPRPVVNLENATATIKNNGSLEIEISGKAREYVSELLASGAGAITSLDVFLNGDLVDTITDLPVAGGTAPIHDPWLRRDSTITFSKTITVPDLVPGLHNVVVKSNNNAVGLQGWDGISLLVEKQDYNDIVLQNPPAFTIVLNGDLTSAADSITLQSNGASAVLSEPEGGEDSGLFSGQMDFGGTQRQIRVQLSPLLSLSASARDDLTGEVSWQDGSGGRNVVQSIWKETTDNSKQFATVNALATVESWSNLQITHLSHDAGSSGGEMNPFIVRFQTTEEINPFGEDAILDSEMNGEEVEFKESAGLLGESPPQGMKWYYLHAGDEPRVFLLNEKLAGSIHAPSQILADGEIKLDFHVIGNDSESIEDKASVNRPYDIPSTQTTAAPGMMAAPASQPNGPEVADFTMEDIRFWFEFFFEDAGMNLLTQYEAGNNNDSGLNISLEKVWAIDDFWSSGQLYEFDGTWPCNMATGFSPKQATLKLNRFKIKSPIDGAVALFTALQELRGKSNGWLRNGLTFDWTDILDAYAAGESMDQNVEQALRQSRLAPLSDTLAVAKSAYEIGFSFVPGGELVITANDVDTALVEGNSTGVAVAVGAILAPKVLEKTIKYAKRTLRIVKLDLKSAGVTNWTVKELEILHEAGVGRRISRIDKMDSLRPHIESGDLVLDDTKIDALRANLNYGEGGIDLGINPDNSRAILRRQLNMAPGSKLEAHHDLPICANAPDLEKEFLKRGIDPNKAEHGRPLEIEKHKLIHGKGTSGWPFGDPYIHQWDIFFKRNEAAGLDEIRTFRDQLRQITSQPFSNADELPWIYSKTDQ